MGRADAAGEEPATSVHADAVRAAALRDTGLTALADAGMDRFARLVTRVVGVPVALVSLLESDRQIFPGMLGLAEPWASARQTPLSHALCRHVVASARPLVLSDARESDLTCANAALTELGVVAYAGMPLTDSDGHVLGSLCAIDTDVRAWSADELRDLEDLAAACSTELRLRVVSRQREQARRGEAQARQEADALAKRTESTLARSQVLLRAADALADTTGIDEVRRRVSDLMINDLQPVYVGLILVEGEWMRRLTDDGDGAAMERANEYYRLDSNWPTARAARENRTITVHGLDALAAQYGSEAVAAFTQLGLETVVCVPLPGTVVPLGVLVVGWDIDYEIDIIDQAVLASLAGYTARAVERATFVDNRADAARQLQTAMLTDLPVVPGLESAALYRAAADDDMVGGDWYDLYQLPDNTAPHTVTPTGSVPTSPLGTVVASIGDITGHDMHAATLMGQARSMLRQADVDHADTGPATVLSALERANLALNVDASGTLVHAHLRPSGTAGAWEMTWTNAGHMPPILVTPDGGVEHLTDHQTMIHPALPLLPRESYRRLLEPGTMLLLFTDGLVERPGLDIDVTMRQTAHLLQSLRERDLPTVLEQVADTIAGHTPDDDIALLALRIPPLLAHRPDAD
ncbi:GAF domain-containing SpoIIE family protein phosphatase [Streptomyces sp. NPDC102467]|uniref:GAF domain-containing SpoIIE family protein phosphatase n=1 Tax=Streptomyces sp. NPDC102467 TaxID=3366179 RepID=UPI0037F112BF